MPTRPLVDPAARARWRQTWHRFDTWSLNNANPVLYRPRRDWLPDLRGPELIRDLGRKVSAATAALRRRRRLEQEVAQYSATSDVVEIETILERGTAEETSEVRDILTQQAIRRSRPRWWNLRG
ncbi:MAG: hypothetical protein ABJC62_02545 [Frankiaceae bacterium]